MALYSFRPFCFTLRRMILRDTTKISGRTMADAQAAELDFNLTKKYEGKHGLKK